MRSNAAGFFFSLSVANCVECSMVDWSKSARLAPSALWNEAIGRQAGGWAGQVVNSLAAASQR